MFNSNIELSLYPQRLGPSRLNSPINTSFSFESSIFLILNEGTNEVGSSSAMSEDDWKYLSKIGYVFSFHSWKSPSVLKF